MPGSIVTPYMVICQKRKYECPQPAKEGNEERTESFVENNRKLLPSIDCWL